jgi:hypothetical protein
MRTRAHARPNIDESQGTRESAARQAHEAGANGGTGEGASGAGAGAEGNVGVSATGAEGGAAGGAFDASVPGPSGTQCRRTWHWAPSP